MVQRLQTRKVRIALAVAAFIVVCGVCSLCTGAFRSATPSTSQSLDSQPVAAPATDTPAATDTVTPSKPKAWVTVQHFTGNNTQQTPTFTASDGSRIVWSASADNDFGGSFSITSYGNDGSYGDLIANTSTPPKASGTFNIHGDQDIYLKVDTYGCTYDIVVQEYR